MPFRGHHVSEEELDRSLFMAKKNGKQVNNLNANYHCDPEELNTLHPFWKDACDPEPILPSISFDKSSSVRDETDKDLRENTDFIERSEKPLYKVANLVKALFAGKPIWKIVSPIKDKFILKAMDLIFEEVLEQINSGKTYCFSNCTSLKMRSNPSSINKIGEAYVIFRYIAGFPPLPILREDKLQGVEEKIRRLHETIERRCGDGLFQVGPCKTNPPLVRQASRSIFCSPPK